MTDHERLDLRGYRTLPDRSVRQLEVGDKLYRADRLVTVKQVKDGRRARIVTFDDAPAMTVSSPIWADTTVTIYRPRAGF